MGKDDWRRPEVKGATLLPREWKKLPTRCRMDPSSLDLALQGRHCDGPVDRMARSVGEPGTVAGRCRQCGQVYIAPEEP